MYRKRPELTPRQLYTEYINLKSLGILCAGLVVLFLVGAAGFGVHMLFQGFDRSNDADQQSHLVSLFGGHIRPTGSIAWPQGAGASAYRTQVASNLLLESSSADDQYLKPFLDRNQLRQVVAHGAPPNLANPQIVDRFSSYLHWVLHDGLPVGGQVMVCMIWILYCFECRSNHEQLIALPWRKWWVYPFVVVTLPVALPFYPVSYLRGVWLRHSASNHEVTPVELSANLPTRLKSPQTVEEAHGEYLKLRGERFLTGLRQTVDALISRISSAEWELDTLEDQMEVAQRSVANGRRDLVEAKAALDQVAAAEQSAEAHAAEFDRLLELPGVVGIQVNTWSVKLFVGPVIVLISGSYFDLGDYVVTVKPGIESLPDVVCVRDTNQRGYGHPYHEYGGGFCFGTRNAMLKSLQAAGDITGIASVVTESLFFVNAEDEAKVKKHYPEVTP